MDEQLQDALQKRVTESFKAVNDQLEQVYKGLGEMQNLAADVGGLKQVLSGVKTRGILGENPTGCNPGRDPCPGTVRHQCGHHPGQYSAGGICHPDARRGRRHGLAAHRFQFPGDTYAHLQDAQASGDAQAVENARHAMELKVLRSGSRGHREKYVEPPRLTGPRHPVPAV